LQLWLNETICPICGGELQYIVSYEKSNFYFCNSCKKLWDFKKTSSIDVEIIDVKYILQKIVRRNAAT